MKIVTYTLLFGGSLSILSLCSTEEKGRYLSSNIERIHYSISNEDYVHNWKISPEVNPDVLEVPCSQTKKSNIKFVTDIDSISIPIEVGDTINFGIIFQGDTAQTQLIGIPKNVSFNEAYIKENQGKYIVDIPEVSELINIAIAVSSLGRVDSNLVDMTSSYHQEVIDHFSSFKDHPLIDFFNLKMSAVSMIDAYNFYFDVKTNACEYEYLNENTIVHRGSVLNTSLGGQPNPILEFIDLLEDFSAKSEFRKFYKTHTPYYRKLIQDYRSLIPLNKMWNWMEKNFVDRYDCYRVFFSPLVYGAHCSRYFEDDGFKQLSMYVAPLYYSKENKESSEIINSRVVFTEIDHGYINPLTKRYLPTVSKVFENYSNWATEYANKQYKSGELIFNEYMTWALYSLYCYDTFPSDKAMAYVSRMEKQMVVDRGFVKFAAFNQFLINLYERSKAKGTKVYELYPEIIEWCNSQT